MKHCFIGLKQFLQKKTVLALAGIVLGIVLSVVIFAGGVFLGKEIYRSNETIEVSKYTVTDERMKEDVRMAVIADLHNHEFGSGNEVLLSQIEAQSPDLILFVGDVIMDEDEDIEVARELMQELVKIAPVYFSMGNHEVHHQMNFPVLIEEIFESLGVHVLEYEYEDIMIKGQTIRLGGIYGYCVPERTLDEDRYNPKITKFLEEFQDTELYTVLLTHIPYAWLSLDGLEAWDIDLVLSGHTHGGLIKFGDERSLYAPLQGIFQKDIDGRYDSKDGSRSILVTRGLGSSSIIPRLNNIPEVMIVDLKSNE